MGLLTFLVALALRIVGSGWGLPSELRITSLHPDEPINWMVTRAATDFTPNFYNYGTLFFTLNNAALAVLHALGLGVPDTGEGTIAGLAQEFATGRFLNCLFGAGTAWVVFAFLFKRVHWAGALAGGAAVAFAPGLVVHSRFMTVDVMATFFIAVSLYWSAEAIEDQSWRPILLAALFAGLAAGAKYNGVLALIALAPALLKDQSLESAKRGVAAIGVTCLTFLVCVPGVILEREAFMRDFNYEMWHTSTGHGLVFAGTSPGFIFHWSNLFVAFGFLLTVMGLVGLGRLVIKKSGWAIAIGLFFILYFLLIAKAEVKFMRYVLPLIPVLAIGFGWLVGRMQEHPNRRKWSWGVAMGICALAGLGRGGMADSVIATTMMLDQDPRDRAASSLRGFESVGVVADPWFYTPSFYPETVAPRPYSFAQRETWRLAARSPEVLRFVPENPDARLDWDPRLITDLKPVAIAFSSFEQEGYDRLAMQQSDRDDVERYAEFAKLLLENYDLESTFGGGLPEVHDLMYIHPTVQIWKRKSTSSSTISP